MPKASNDVTIQALAGELRVSIGKLVRRVREHSGPGDFTPAQQSVLLRLERDGASTVSALARAESVRPQSMRITVLGLEAMGAVKGSADRSDARQTIFVLTPAFLKTIKTRRAMKEDWLCRALEAQLTSRERKELAGAVRLLEMLAEF